KKERARFQGRGAELASSPRLPNPHQTLLVAPRVTHPAQIRLPFLLHGQPRRLPIKSPAQHAGHEDKTPNKSKGKQRRGSNEVGSFRKEPPIPPRPREASPPPSDPPSPPPDSVTGAGDSRDWVQQFRGGRENSGSGILILDRYC
ncbi:hypothetical protein U9M48_012826, partial [Paspalum notatum var. saurae]